MLTLHEGLKKWFGFSEFRPLQEEIVTSILKGEDVLALLPTGGGKSLCFQLPGLIRGGLTIVVSPLISLMTDQIAHLTARGIPAVTLNSTITAQTREKIQNELLSGLYRFLYVSPETLSSKWLHTHAKNLQITLFVIDEAHCISEWGHHFRPEYLHIRVFLEKIIQRPPIAAFTASATPKTVDDIIKSLHLHTPKIFRQSVERANLSLKIVELPTKTLQWVVLLRLLSQYENQPVIIYCATRSQTEVTASRLSAHRSAAAYHGGMEAAQRSKIQDDFLNDRIQIICATNAFGMGVDKANIRCIIHLTMPASIEAYYQEVGRAGRDGSASSCYLLTLSRDAQLQYEILANGFPPFSQLSLIAQYLRESTISLALLYRELLDYMDIYQLKRTIAWGEKHSWWKVDRQKKTLARLIPYKDFMQSLTHDEKIFMHQHAKLTAMYSLAQTSKCRARTLEKYFEPERHVLVAKRKNCGQCDICRPPKELLPTAEEEKISHSLQSVYATLPKISKLSVRPATLQLIAQLRAVEQLVGSITTHTPGTVDRPQSHAGDSSRAFQLLRSPPPSHSQLPRRLILHAQ